MPVWVIFTVHFNDFANSLVFSRAGPDYGIKCPILDLLTAVLVMRNMMGEEKSEEKAV